MQTGNLTFEPGSKYSWSTNKVIGQLQIPNYLIRKQPAKLGKLACVQINGMYPTTTFFLSSFNDFSELGDTGKTLRSEERKK